MELSEQLTIHFTKKQLLHLAPFCATWITYYILYLPLFGGYPVETIGSAFFKILPILSLCFYVISASRDFNGLPSMDNLLPEDNRSRFMCLGLLVSCLGDICLVWREFLFIPGLLFFAIAQIMYLYAFQEGTEKSRTKSVFAMLGMSVYLCISSGISNFLVSGLVLIYMILIFTLAWRATARYETEGNKAAMAGCFGALLFLFSDFIIAVDKWCFSVPFAICIIMTSYYGGQLGLALSTTKDLE